MLMRGKLIFVLVGLLTCIFSILVWDYQLFNRCEQDVKNRFKCVENCLLDRFDFIFQLVQGTKGHLSYEKSIILELTAAREHYMRVAHLNDKIMLAVDFEKKLSQFLAILEAHPALKASEEVQKLLGELSRMEREIMAQKECYNAAAASYNNQLYSLPSSIVAWLYGFKEKPFFKIESASQTRVRAFCN